MTGIPATGRRFRIIMFSITSVDDVRYFGRGILIFEGRLLIVERVFLLSGTYHPELVEVSIRNFEDFLW